MIDPPRWDPERLEKDRKKAVALFRAERLEEPVEQYAAALERYQGVVEDLLETTVDLGDLSPVVLSRILSDADFKLAFRYLAGPPISEDDLMTLAEVVSLAPARLGAKKADVRRLLNVVRNCIDRRRFPWFSEGREPTEAERNAATLASACLIAHQRVQTARRQAGKNRLEGAVQDCLKATGFSEVLRRKIELLGDAPGPGEFCGETACAGRRADFVVGLRDGRHMMVECKDSNSLVNSIKRLNNDTAAKATRWIRTFGERAVVPVAVISGVYYLKSLIAAQEAGLTIFWEHDIALFADWLKRTASPTKQR